MLNLAVRRLRLRRSTAEQFGSVVYDSVSVSVECQPRVITVCRGPCRVNCRTNAKHIKVYAADTVRQIKPVAIDIDNNRRRANSIDAFSATVCQANGAHFLIACGGKGVVITRIYRGV